MQLYLFENCGWIFADPSGDRFEAYTLVKTFRNLNAILHCQMLVLFSGKFIAWLLYFDPVSQNNFHCGSYFGNSLEKIWWK